MTLKVGGRHPEKEPVLPKIVLYGMVATTVLIFLGGMIFIYKMLKA